jgi:AraC-like DNA-binding protein
MTQGARIFAAQRYRLSTLTVPCDLIVAVLTMRRYTNSTNRLKHTPSTAVMRHRSLEALLLLEEKGYRFAPAHELSWTERIQRLNGQRIDADWNVSAIAQAFHMSESTLRRRLADSDTTLAAIVRDNRLQTALGMLQTSDLSVGEVAQRCGWESHSRFTAAFQQRWGVAPSVVRARMKERAQDLADKG